jgi:hypothetical protein
MKITGKLLAAAFAVMILIMIPGIAFANGTKESVNSGRSYVPTAGIEYIWDEAKSKWVPSGETFKAVFDKRGKIRSLDIAWKSDDGREIESLKYTYQWKGDNLKRESLKYVSSNDGKAGERYSAKTTYKVKHKKPVKEKNVCYYYDEDGKLAASFTTETKYKWNKNNKKGSGKTKSSLWNKEGNEPYTRRSSDLYTLKSGKISTSREDGYSFKYYKNGNLKSITKFSADGETRSVTDFNKAGYRVKFSYSSKDKNGAATGYVTTYRWSVVDRKPKSVEWFTKDLSGRITDRYRYRYTKTKKVAQSRNCDVFGLEVWLGIWGE